MQVGYASENAPGVANEDLVIGGSNWVAVLDGATAPPSERETGCSHTVVWYARHLGAHLGHSLTIDPEIDLVAALARAIEATNADHVGTCDLSNPDSPSSTATLIRERDGVLDYLVLADSPLVLHVGGEIRAIVDERVASLEERSLDAVSRSRNRPGGFWVASTVPEAAEMAITGSVATEGLHAAALLTDGASRLVERFGRLDWSGLMDVLVTEGPAALIARTRLEENNGNDRLAGKLHDDASAVYVTNFG